MPIGKNNRDVETQQKQDRKNGKVGGSFFDHSFSQAKVKDSKLLYCVYLVTVGNTVHMGLGISRLRAQYIY